MRKTLKCFFPNGVKYLVNIDKKNRLYNISVAPFFALIRIYVSVYGDTSEKEAKETILQLNKIVFLPRYPHCTA